MFGVYNGVSQKYQSRFRFRGDNGKKNLSETRLEKDLILFWVIVDQLLELKVINLVQLYIAQVNNTGFFRVSAVLNKTYVF